MTDSAGRKVDFRNTVIVMTTNVGARKIGRNTTVGFQKDDEDEQYKKMKDRVIEEAKKVFNPEFLNRVDEIIIFHSLTRKQVKKIVDIMIGDLRDRLGEKELGLEVTDAAKEIILEHGWDAEYGARPLRRAIQREIENRVAKVILDGECEAGCSILVDGQDGRIAISITGEPVAVEPAAGEPAEVGSEEAVAER